MLFKGWAARGGYLVFPRKPQEELDAFLDELKYGRTQDAVRGVIAMVVVRGNSPAPWTPRW